MKGTRPLNAPEKLNSFFLWKAFRKDCRQFLEEFVNTILSTTTARSLVGKCLSCFCPEFLIGKDKYETFYLLGLPLDGLSTFDSAEGNDVEAAKAEIYSFVREQRQLEKSASTTHAPTKDVLSFCCGQPGFHSRRNLYKVFFLVAFYCLYII